MNRNFDFITDSCSGMTDAFYAENEVKMLPLGCTLGETTYGGMEGALPDPAFLYRSLREGVPCHTFQVTAEQAKPAVEDSFRKGRDVLIVAFSSVLSGTASSFSVAADEMTEKYPERKALVLDSVSGSMGEGLLLESMIKKAEEGADIDEVYEYGNKLKYHIQHLFTVDDLEFLKRGGRISSAVAVVGKLLKIKPMLHVNYKGAIIPAAKIVGRKRSIEALAEGAKKLAEMDDDDPIYIGHGDCLEEAKQLEQMLRDRLGKDRRIEINFIDPVMGTHGGPGILAVYFKGKAREPLRIPLLTPKDAQKS